MMRARARLALVLTTLLVSVPLAVRADETCNSPYMANLIKGQEDYVYVWALGIKDLVGRIEAGEIARPDFVVYVEPTRLSVYPAQIGFFITDITITGKSAYFGVPELGKDALRASHAAMSALWKHSEEIAARAEHKLIGRILRAADAVEAPLPLRLMACFAPLRRIPARLIGMGVRPEHVRTPDAGAGPGARA